MPFWVLEILFFQSRNYTTLELSWFVVSVAAVLLH